MSIVLPSFGSKANYMYSTSNIRAKCAAYVASKSIRALTATAQTHKTGPVDGSVYDVIVIGGGHAGTEAAAASARTGAKTALVTHKMESVGEMSCNPAFGGIGKGTLVREIDALGGLCGRICDEAGIHFRILNRRKGAAVQGPRAQIDRDLYKAGVQRELLTSTPNLEIIAVGVDDLIISNKETQVEGEAVKCVTGVTLGDGSRLYSGAVVLSTGTFLRGQINVGDKNYPAGRIGDAPAIGLAHALYDQNFKMGRMRTGTPPRLDGKTIDFTNLEAQPGDEEPIPFSYLNDTVTHADNQIKCYMTFTNEKAHQITRDTLHLNNHVTGESKGPRYCPSIESKVLRFDRPRHQIWLEPEGLSTDLIYPNGISMTMPEEAQERFVHEIAGLENVTIVRPGYGVEYDYVDPRQLYPWLETQMIGGLFLAGQINGTTGYEEAAAQGIMAGINAALKVMSAVPKAINCTRTPIHSQTQILPMRTSTPTRTQKYRTTSPNGMGGEWTPFILDRSEAFIGVLIDDLVSQGVSEPYRMFTSRAEYRLHLRSDNADLRLTEKAHEYAPGVVCDVRLARLWDVVHKMEAAKIVLRDTVKSPDAWSDLLEIKLSLDGKKRSAWDMLSFQAVDMAMLSSKIPRIQAECDPSVYERLDVEGSYNELLARQQTDIDNFKRDENVALPLNFDFMSLSFLDMEAKEALQITKPLSIGAASRIPGITPSHLIQLLKYVNKSRRRQRRVGNDSDETSQAQA
eukprot:CFRG7510T1